MKTILFVCTGNICRSPMAEGLFRHAVKGRSDFRVLSAGVGGLEGGPPSEYVVPALPGGGVGAVEGAPPSEYAVRALRELGIDISNQRSRMLTSELVQKADYIFGMT